MKIFNRCHKTNEERRCRLYSYILLAKDSQMRDTIWYSLGSLCSSATSMVIVLVVTRVLGQEVSGIFSLAWSAAQLMLTIGWFSTRQYQVSTEKETISYYEYFVAKIVSSGLMLLAGVVYIYIYHYTTQTKVITMLLCIMMVADVFADFFSAFFQCNNKLYIGGISYFVRNISYMVVFTITLMVHHNLFISIMSAIFFEVLWLFCFDYQLIRMMPRRNKSVRVRTVMRVFTECFPLFGSSFILTFIVNIPKNAINMYMNDRVQASYNILFMPTAVINMFNMFICVPFYGRLATLWHEKQRRNFLIMICKIESIVIVMTMGFVIGGALVGIPILSWLYGVNLQPYMKEFLILILGGGCYGAASVLTYVITVFRKQKNIIGIYLLGASLAQVLAGVLVCKLGMIGAAMTYTVAMGVICMGLVLYIWYYLKTTVEGK